MGWTKRVYKCSPQAIICTVERKDIAFLRTLKIDPQNQPNSLDTKEDEITMMVVAQRSDNDVPPPPPNVPHPDVVEQLGRVTEPEVKNMFSEE